MEVAVSSEISVEIYQITRRHNSEDKFRSHRWRNVKSEIYDCIYQVTQDYHGSCQHVSALCGLTALKVHGLAETRQTEPTLQVSRTYGRSEFWILNKVILFLEPQNVATSVVLSALKKKKKRISTILRYLELHLTTTSTPTQL
jgi:hypothetical protein